MQKALKLSWRNIPPSEAVEAHVREEIQRLERFYGRITGCAVTLDAPSRHHRHGAQQYRVRIELTVPREKLVVTRDRARSRANADLYSAVRAAFREARRQLRDHVERIDARVKLHEEPAHGVVARVAPDYGFIRTADGREIYFNARSVLRGAFARLRVGDPVRFAEEAGEEGPQASTVEALRAHAEGAAAAP
jgi:ribosomal subunit interface protein